MDTQGNLIEVFARHMPAGARVSVQETQECRAVLAAVLEATRAAFPSVHLTTEAFFAYLGERIGETEDPMVALHTLRVGDLFLACACSRGDEQALVVFDTHYAPKVDGALGRLNLSKAMTDEVHQRLREKLLVAHDDRPPEITKYSGRGRLCSWVRVVAIRLALGLLQERQREVPTSDEVMQAITPCQEDPEMVYLKHLYRREFKVAFGEAMASLTSRERNLLRHQMIDRLSIDEIGALYKVHRSTAARRLARIRQALARKIRHRMMEQLGIPKREYESILRLISSRIELSISRYLKTTQGPERSHQKATEPAEA